MRIRECPAALALLCAMTLGLATGAAAQTPGEPALIHAGTLLAEPGEAPLDRQTLLIRDGRVADIIPGFADPADHAVDGETPRLIDLSSHFVLPGLIDAHVHITSESAPGGKLRGVEQTGADQALSGAMNARRTLMAGFTTVRDAAGFRGDDFDAVFALRDAIGAGKVAGPRMVVSGQGLTPTAGHGDYMGFRPDVMELLAPSGICDGADDCRRATRYMIKRGADFIKIAVTGGVTSLIEAGLDQQMTDAEIQAVVETAAMFGRRVAAHAHGVNGINAALRAGVASIEHGTYMDEESIGLFRETGAFLVPTMLAAATSAERAANDPTLPREVREKSGERTDDKAAQVRRAYEAGVRLAFGTDAAISPHGDNAGEFGLLVAAGIPPMQAIRMATVNAAELVGLQDEVGRLAPGMAADVIALRDNPLEDISALRRVDFVMQAGFVHRADGRQYALP